MHWIWAAKMILDYVHQHLRVQLEKDDEETAEIYFHHERFFCFIYHDRISDMLNMHTMLVVDWQGYPRHKTYPIRLVERLRLNHGLIMTLHPIRR